ncbi:complex I subunit 1/NuoH family protein [Bdellovibrio svalbardensis]|uniref:NADH-quinone oxidoreductase subunit H n=1 Tax=Bdellovibrio svalbardensis TaxID=2972972 RepID=A0ABT6DDN7_9BACT|nr:complex I subunit 1 family protein [Bdellovibrio svalbardensis]MDG0814956.1 NADH-quinone oxidoreductase subunit H [Bdellovibrio svalbardensis]
MGKDAFEIIVNGLKLVIIFLMIVQLVPILVWVERRGSAFIQNRLGPNRVGPLGLMQLLADAVKFLTKEAFVPDTAKPLLYYAAPIFALIPGAVAFAAIPMSTPFTVGTFELFGQTWGPYTFLVQGYDIGIGIVFILGVSSLAAYTLLMAGWGSGNKYSLMGALRASAQTISYELALGLSIVGVIMMYGTFNLSEMIGMQQGGLHFTFMGYTIAANWLPNWGIFYQPLGALLFFTATFAESNRLPFDLAEGEAELVAGFHTEYGGFKFNMFFIGEYGHMMVAAGLMIIFFFGGYSIPYVSVDQVHQWAASVTSTPNWASALTALIHFLVFNVKFFAFLWIFIWVRWTLPRFRYDQLMDLGWKTMLPWALGNTILTAFVIYIASL